jgi:hypothetical protein
MKVKNLTMQAFPFIEPIDNDDAVKAFHPGMTLRDYFAAKAMQSLVLMSTGEDNEIPDAAEAAYWYADAMMKERK